MNELEDLMHQMYAVLHYDGMFHARATGCDTYAKDADPVVAMTKALELPKVRAKPTQSHPTPRRRILWGD